MALHPVDDSEETFDNGLEEDDDREPEPPPVVVAPPAPPKNKGGRPRKVPPQSQHVGVGTAANVPPPSNDLDPSTWGTDPYYVWPLLLEWAKEGCGKGQPMGPSEIKINVYRMGSPGNPQKVLIGSMDGEVVAGLDGEHPSDALRNRLIDDFHFPTGQGGPATYKLEMTWRKGGKIIKAGDMLLPSKEEIRMLRIQKDNREAGARAAGMGAAPYSPPQQPYSPHYPPQPPPQPYPQYPPQQQQQGQGSNQQVMAMQYELDRAREREARTQGQLEEVMKALREGRQPTLDPQPPAPSNTSGVVTEVIQALAALGVIGKQQPVGVGAAAPSPPTFVQPAPQAAPPPDPMAGIETMLAGLVRLKKVARQVDVLTGDAVDAVAEVVSNEPPPMPDDGLDWAAAATGAKWPDGSDIRFAKKKDGSGVNWTGVLFENGFVGQKVMETAEAVIKPIGEAAQKIMGGMVQTVPQPGTPPPVAPQDHVAQTVNGIPRGAVDANEYPAT